MIFAPISFHNALISFMLVNFPFFSRKMVDVCFVLIFYHKNSYIPSKYNGKILM
jgi:hypothetical protein